MVPKTEQTMKAIRERLQSLFMFREFSPEDMQIVIDAMTERKAKAGECMIRQGEAVYHLYIV